MSWAFVWQVLAFSSLTHYCSPQLIDPSTYYWDYQRAGPDTWYRSSLTCNGEFQSPINIDTSRVRYDASLRPLSLNGYTMNTSLYMWNFTHDGRTIIVYPPPLARFTISGANLPETFYLVQFHFHWGYNSFQGSEHTIDERKYPLEVQFVHRAPTSGAFAVISVLFHLQRDDNPYLTDFVSILNQTRDPSVSIEYPCDVSPLFPLDISPRFYRYNGSLTSPPCTERVSWIILLRTVPISQPQLNVFMNNAVSANFRPTQKLNGRQVLANFPVETYGNIEPMATTRGGAHGETSTGGHGGHGGHGEGGHEGGGHEPDQHGSSGSTLVKHNFCSLLLLIAIILMQQ